MAPSPHELRTCRVTLVDSGEAAVEAATEQQYCLIVLDARMPGIGGLEASRRLRTRLGRDTPIVLLTADSRLPSSDLEQYGITAAYVKPLSEKDIEIKILSLMELKASADATSSEPTATFQRLSNLALGTNGPGQNRFVAASFVVGSKCHRVLSPKDSLDSRPKN